MSPCRHLATVLMCHPLPSFTVPLCPRVPLCPPRPRLRTALELALAHGSLEVAELLQGHQGDKDTGNVTGKAPSWALRRVPNCKRRGETS